MKTIHPLLYILLGTGRMYVACVKDEDSENPVIAIGSMPKEKAVGEEITEEEIISSEPLLAIEFDNLQSLFVLQRAIDAAASVLNSGDMSLICSNCERANNFSVEHMTDVEYVHTYQPTGNKVDYWLHGIVKCRFCGHSERYNCNRSEANDAN